MLELIIADDYHDIPFVASCIPGANGEEIGTTYDGCHPHLMYVGILWRGRRPGHQKIAKLLEERGIKLVEEPTKL